MQACPAWSCWQSGPARHPQSAGRQAALPKYHMMVDAVPHEAATSAHDDSGERAGRHPGGWSKVNEQYQLGLRSRGSPESRDSPERPALDAGHSSTHGRRPAKQMRAAGCQACQACACSCVSCMSSICTAGNQVIAVVAVREALYLPTLPMCLLSQRHSTNQHTHRNRFLF